MDELGEALLIRARNAIAAEFGLAPRAEPGHPSLTVFGATFVTLTRDDELRGCVGSLEAWRPLSADILANARAAAFRDPRFPPLAQGELTVTRVEVSLLSASRPMQFSDEPDALWQLRPGVDGVIFECDGRRATFLPQVWESLPEPKDFLAHLRQKAGFAPDFWAPAIRLHRYEVTKWKESQNS